MDCSLFLSKHIKHHFLYFFQNMLKTEQKIKSNSHTFHRNFSAAVPLFVRSTQPWAMLFTSQLNINGMFKAFSLHPFIAGPSQDARWPFIKREGPNMGEGCTSSNSAKGSLKTKYRSYIIWTPMNQRNSFPITLRKSLC